MLQSSNLSAAAAIKPTKVALRHERLVSFGAAAVDVCVPMTLPPGDPPKTPPSPALKLDDGTAAVASEVAVIKKPC